MDVRVRNARRLAAGVVVGLLVALSSATAATADPGGTSEQDVKDAHRAVTSAKNAVASLEVRLAQQNAIRDAAWVAVEAAGEKYTQAEVDREAAVAAAALAVARADDAATRMEAARHSLVAIAIQATRSGGEMESVQAFLSADGFDEVVERSTALSKVSARADQAVQEFRATRLVAETLERRATEAKAKQEAATAAAKDALAAAEKAKTEADAAVAAAEAERSDLIEQLAAARQTSAAVERARQDQLDAERKARQEAAAKAERTNPRPSAGGSTSGGGSTGGGSTGGGSTGGSSTGGGSAGGGSTGGGSTGGGSVTPTPTPTPTTPSNAYGLGTGRSQGSASQGAAAVAWAIQRAGLPYGWGATGAAAYDCSGLTMRAWQHAGVNLNRTSRDQYRQVLKISYADLRPGDLVFWSTDPNNVNAIHHVALWAGNGQIMEAPRPDVPLRLTAMRWSGTMPFAGRP